MFSRSKFNQDISKWNTSKFMNMSWMFKFSEFNGDVSSWDLSSTINSEDVFLDSEMAKKISIKNPTFEQVKSHFLNLKLESDLQKSPEKNGLPRARL